DRDRRELLQPRRAAEPPAAGAVAVLELRLVAGEDLAQLDATLEGRREGAGELAEVDAAIGGEVEEDPAAVERRRRRDDLHPLEPEAVDVLLGDADLLRRLGLERAAALEVGVVGAAA